MSPWVWLRRISINKFRETVDEFPEDERWDDDGDTVDPGLMAHLDNLPMCKRTDPDDVEPFM